MSAPKKRKPVADETQTGLQEMSQLGGNDSKDPSAKTDNGQPKLTRQARWRRENPKAFWAHSATASAVQRGLIERQSCEVCGDPKTDAHHPDYDRPLAVQWLCRRHHREEHKRLRGGNHGSA